MRTKGLIRMKTKVRIRMRTKSLIRMRTRGLPRMKTKSPTKMKIAGHMRMIAEERTGLTKKRAKLSRRRIGTERNTYKTHEAVAPRHLSARSVSGVVRPVPAAEVPPKVSAMTVIGDGHRVRGLAEGRRAVQTRQTIRESPPKATRILHTSAGSIRKSHLVESPESTRKSQKTNQKGRTTNPVWRAMKALLRIIVDTPASTKRRPRRANTPDPARGLDLETGSDSIYSVEIFI